MLFDAGPMVALLDRRDASHKACLGVLQYLKDELVTTWPVLTETMYFAAQLGGLKAQDAVWEMASGLKIANIDSNEDRTRMRDLMVRYGDRPMDLADASLVRVAERDGIRKIFTLDRADFATYRIARRGPTKAASFQILP
jgi:predicted nucleic acid-binding protein